MEEKTRNSLMGGLECVTWSSLSAPLGAGVRRMEYRSVVDGNRDWCLIERPPAGARRWVIMLHGHGSHADQLYTRADIRDSWLPVLRGLGVGIVAPNLRDNAWMGPAATADLHALLQSLREEFDIEQFLLLGGSMGGSGALIYAVRHPRDISGVVAMCPATDVGNYHRWCRDQTTGPAVLQQIADAIEASYGGNPQQVPSTYAQASVLQNAASLSMPVAIAHGCDDSIIPITHSRALLRNLPAATSRLYEEIPCGDHDAPLPWAPEMLRWVMARLDHRQVV